MPGKTDAGEPAFHMKVPLFTLFRLQKKKEGKGKGSGSESKRINDEFLCFGTPDYRPS